MIEGSRQRYATFIKFFITGFFNLQLIFSIWQKLQLLKCAQLRCHEFSLFDAPCQKQHFFLLLNLLLVYFPNLHFVMNIEKNLFLFKPEFKLTFIRSTRKLLSLTLVLYDRIWTSISISFFQFVTSCCHHCHCVTKLWILSWHQIGWDVSKPGIIRTCTT